MCSHATKIDLCPSKHSHLITPFRLWTFYAFISIYSFIFASDLVSYFGLCMPCWWFSICVCEYFSFSIILCFSSLSTIWRRKITKSLWDLYTNQKNYTKHAKKCRIEISVCFFCVASNIYMFQLFICFKSYKYFTYAYMSKVFRKMYV